jgi:DNA-binding protein H-NS
MDLSEMSLKDLQKHEKDVHQAITDYEARRLKTARDACAALAKEHGFTLDEIVGNKSKKSGAKAPAKYRNPADPSKTWAGKGRKPDWINDAIARGDDIETFLI